MSIRGLIVFLIWAVPISSMLACPYDLHGVSTCSEASLVGREVSFYLALPGLAIGLSVR
jgi:CBS-domain-containing membrane protein